MPTLTLPHITLHYLEEGRGPPLLWFPGGNDCAALMLHAHRRLAERMRLICVDPRGQGRSDPRHTPEEYAPECYVEDIRAVLDALGLERAIVGGHSRGGRMSVEFALSYPERVAAVVAAASPLLGFTPERGRRFNRYQRVLREHGVDAFLAEVNTGPRHPERRAIWVQAAHHAGPVALDAQYEALRRLGPLTGRMAGLQVPALFVCGRSDPLLDHSRACAGASPRARLAEIDGAGHAVFADNPEPYFEVLCGFLDEVIAAS
jgi:3-oxoadipate enol-lactonase